MTATFFGKVYLTCTLSFYLGPFPDFVDREGFIYFGTAHHQGALRCFGFTFKEVLCHLSLCAINSLIIKSHFVNILTHKVYRKGTVLIFSSLFHFYTLQHLSHQPIHTHSYMDASVISSKLGVRKPFSHIIGVVLRGKDTSSHID